MVIAPSGALREMESLKQGVQIWRNWGFEVDLHPAFSERWGYLAGTDAGRQQQLADALQDDRYRGVLCARGGYGGTRLLEGWQWPQSMIPKWLIGFSDITSLLWSLTKQGIAGVHGPLLTTLGNEPDWSTTAAAGSGHWQNSAAHSWGSLGQGSGDGNASARQPDGGHLCFRHSLTSLL